MNIGIPEILFVLIIVGLLVLAARKWPVRPAAVKYALLALLAVVVATLVFNWTTTFRAVPLWQK